MQSVITRHPDNNHPSREIPIRHHNPFWLDSISLHQLRPYSFPTSPTVSAAARKRRIPQSVDITN